MSASNPVAESIKFSIIKNGYPVKAVRLPFKPVYDNCKKNGTPLADVLELLKAEGVISAMEGDYIIFRSPENAAQVKTPPAEPEADDDSWWSKLPGLGNMQEKAKEAMAKMTPEQLAEVKKQVENMSDDEKKNIMGMMSQFIKKGK